MLVKRNTGMLFKINSARDITQTCKGRALFVYTDSPNGPVAVPNQPTGRPPPPESRQNPA